VDTSPRGRPDSFEDIAAPLWFLFSGATDYISGQNIAFDGGRLPEFDN
jgi:NAD(P)-dependent dehydrogenase (short-subunit alcohol dehydrogenase family)